MKLTFPSPTHRDAVLAFRQACLNAGETFIPGSGGLHQAADYESWLTQVTAQRDPHLTDHPQFVPSTTLLGFTDDGTLVGTVTIYHRLNDRLLQFGGHISYTISPTLRRKGYGSSLLKLALTYAKDTCSLDWVLICCGEESKASRRTILSVGGLADCTGTTPDGEINERYWVSTAPY